MTSLFWVRLTALVFKGAVSDWADLPHVLAHHRQVAVFDNRFLGASFVANAPDYRWRDQYEAVIDLADHLGWNRFFLLGWSMGGMISQYVAVTIPKRIAGLILFSSMWSVNPESKPGFMHCFHPFHFEPSSIFVERDIFAELGSFGKQDKEKALRYGVEVNMSDAEIESHPALVNQLVAASAKVRRPMREIAKQAGAIAECAGVRPVEDLPCRKTLFI